MPTMLPSKLRAVRAWAVCTVAAALWLHAPAARAIILYSTGDATANTTAPTGALAGSGWQYQGQFAGFLGTPIAPGYFVSAKHFGGIGLVGNTIVYQGVSYTTTAGYEDPGSDLCIYRINGTFPTFAPLYTQPSGELGLSLVVFGRGTERGGQVLVGADNHLGGWLHGADSRVQRWGTNTVSAIVSDPAGPKYLYATFDVNSTANEAHLSGGDSGGGVFIQDPSDGIWKLAGINYGVDGRFSTSSTGSNPFNAALFDTTGLFQEVGGTNPYEPANNPSGFYSTEIASRLAFINSIVPEPATPLWLTVGVACLAFGYVRQRARR